MPNLNNRLNYIDVYKGISILCITLLHFENGIFPTWVNNFIGSFMISAFYLTSGLILGSQNKNGSLKDFINKRLYSLGKPYLYASLFILAFNFVLYIFGHLTIYILARDIYKTIAFRGIGTLWFLPALFFGEVLVLFFSKKNNLIKVGVFLAMILYSYTYSFWNINYRNNSTVTQIIDTPLATLSNIAQAYIYIYIFFTIGSMIKLDILSKKKHLSIFTMFLFFFIYTTYIKIGYGNYVSDLIISCFLLTAMLIFSSILSRVKIVNVFFSFWGRNSLIIMITHYSIIQELFIIFNHQILGNRDYVGFVTLIYFAITLFIEFILIFTWKNIQRKQGKYTLPNS